jgi:hypothetical protein
VSSYFILFETESFFKCVARGAGVSTVKRSQSFVNILLRLLSPRSNTGHKKAHQAQNYTAFCASLWH